MKPSGVAIAVLVACHNRRNETLGCLKHVAIQHGGLNIRVFLVDDASIDGTVDAVRKQHPEVTIVPGTGSLYWNRGMFRAYEVATREGGFDHYLLLNDDTRLFPDAIEKLVATYEALRVEGRGECVVVGATVEPGDGTWSYGGWRSKGAWNPARLCPVPLSGRPEACDTMNGNCVLVPAQIAGRVGCLDPVFTHSMGDLDFGFRVKRAGFGLIVAPGAAGCCVANNGKGLWKDGSLTVMERWRKLLGPKGLPVREWWTFTHRHSGPLWILYWANPYVRFWWNVLTRLACRRKAPHGGATV